MSEEDKQQIENDLEVMHSELVDCKKQSNYHEIILIALVDFICRNEPRNSDKSQDLDESQESAELRNLSKSQKSDELKKSDEYQESIKHRNLSKSQDLVEHRDLIEHAKVAKEACLETFRNLRIKCMELESKIEQYKK